MNDVCLSWVQFATILHGAPALKALGLHASELSGKPANGMIATSDVGNVAEDPNHPIQLLT